MRCTLALCVLWISSSAAAFDRAAWLEDYRALKHELELRYAHLAWFASSEGGVDLPALDRATRAALERAASDAEAQAAVAAFVDGFHNPHLSRAQAPSKVAPLPEPPGAHAPDAKTACAGFGYAPSSQVQF